MSASLLEQLRSSHEELERLEKAASQVLLIQEQRCSSHPTSSSSSSSQAGGGVLRGEKRRREHLRLDLATADLLGRMQEHALNCLKIYEDSDSLRKDDVAFLGGKRGGGAGNDVWVNFYERIRQIREFHRKRNLVAASSEGVIMGGGGGGGGGVDRFNPNPLHLPDIRDAQTIVDEVLKTPYVDVLFSEGEHYGEVLDLNEYFTTYINIKPIRSYKINEAKKAETARLLKRGLTGEEVAEKLRESRIEEDLIDYISYLKTFHLFQDLPRALKYRSQEYLSYVKSIADYLQDFFQRRNPLAHHIEVKKKFDEQFEEQWKGKEIPSWRVSSLSLPLYCKPSDRIFLNENTRQSHMQGKKYKKALLELTKLSVEEQKKRDEESLAHDKEIAYAEFLVNAYRDLLESAIERTVAILHKKQSRTADELEEDNVSEGEGDETAAERAVGEAEKDSDDEDQNIDDQPVYNPLNLPLGFDGRPIPFWLYKLHGLGQEFKCEICGNFSYWGRRAFERHFMEWRHAFGMRCLRIPNTTHFKEITKIEDAIKLYEKLKKDAEGKTFKDEQELECEDSQGNVMSLRAYEDLRRQGIL